MAEHGDGRAAASGNVKKGTEESKGLDIAVDNSEYMAVVEKDVRDILEKFPDLPTQVPPEGSVLHLKDDEMVLEGALENFAERTEANPLLVSCNIFAISTATPTPELPLSQSKMQLLRFPPTNPQVITGGVSSQIEAHITAREFKEMIKKRSIPMSMPAEKHHAFLSSFAEAVRDHGDDEVLMQ